MSDAVRVQGNPSDPQPEVLWLDEGLAKFWEMTSIDSERVRIGGLNRRNLKILADEPSLPLPVLFAVDHGSPRYEDTEQSAVFYAQSWALVHYIVSNTERRDRLGDFFQRINKN